MKNYYQFNVPRAMWDEISDQASKMTAMKPTTLALSYLRSGLTTKGPGRPPLPVEKKIKKTRIKQRVLYLYDGSGPEGFTWVEDTERIDHLKKFFYNLRAKELFNKCICDKENLPTGMQLEYVADYASQLYYIKQDHWEDKG